MSIISTLAIAAAGLVIPGAGIFGLVRKFGADLVLGKIRRGLKSAGGFVAANWKPLSIIVAIAAAVIYVLILRADIRHRDKTIAGQNVLIAQVKTEVDRGVGKPTQAGDAPAYVRGFVDNLATVKAALDRQSKALTAAKADAEAHVSAAHDAGKPTPAQEHRVSVHQQLVDPKRTTGLTATEWSQL